MKTYGPLNLGTRSNNFLHNANLMNVDGTVKMTELTQILQSGKAIEYRNVGVQSERELCRFVGIPAIKRHPKICPKCKRPYKT